MDNAPAEGHTERRTSPSDTHPRKRTPKVSTAPTAITRGRRKPRKTAHFQAVDKRAVFVRTIDNLLSAGDNQQQYRPQENPANRYISGLAGDAVGILRRLLRTSLSSFARPLYRLGPLQSRLERVCSRGEGSRGRWGLTGSTSLQSGFYAHLGQADRASGSRPWCELLLPLPGWSFPPHLRKGVAAERICTGRPRYAIADDRDLRATPSGRRSGQRWMGPQVDVKWEGDRTREEDKETRWPTRLHAHDAGTPTRRRTDSADGAAPPWELELISWRVGKVTQRSWAIPCP